MGWEEEEGSDRIWRRVARTIECSHSPGLSRPLDVSFDRTGGVLFRNPHDQEEPILGPKLKPSIDELNQALLLVKP
jgi:hypothetical protein